MIDYCIVYYYRDLVFSSIYQKHCEKHAKEYPCLSQLVILSFELSLRVNSCIAEPFFILYLSFVNVITDGWNIR